MIRLYRHCAYKFLQLLKIDRFGQVMIESGVYTPPHILLHAKAAEGNTHQRLPLSGYAHDVTTVPIGQPDVADQSIETFGLKKFDRRLNTFGSENFVALFSQQRCEYS